jgi:hypothetical protein
MRRAGHASPAAALRYQHATDDRDQVLADALADFAAGATVVPLDAARRAAGETRADIPRTRRVEHEAADTENKP